MQLRKADRVSSLLWLIFSMIICIESYRLNLGSYKDPGPGFFPFLAGLVSTILSLILLILTFGTERKGGMDRVWENIKWKNIIFLLSFMLIYALFMVKLGFLLTTFIFMMGLVRIIEYRKWYVVAIAAIVTTLAAYFVFEVWLKTQLPRGIFAP